MRIQKLLLSLALLFVNNSAKSSEAAFEELCQPDLLPDDVKREVLSQLNIIMSILERKEAIKEALLQELSRAWKANLESLVAKKPKQDAVSWSAGKAYGVGWNETSSREKP